MPAIICNGSASIAYASAGDGQFTYLWEDGSTSQSINVAPTQTTTYSVTVTGPNGCSSEGSVTITVEPNNLTADIGGDRALCLGDSLNFDALISGCTPSTTINSELFASSSMVQVAPISLLLQLVFGKMSVVMMNNGLGRVMRQAQVVQDQTRLIAVTTTSTLTPEMDQQTM